MWYIFKDMNILVRGTLPRLFRGLAVTTLFLLISVSAVFGVDYTWTGSVNSNWAEPGNWTPAGAPAAGPGVGDTAVVNTAVTIFLTSIVNIDGLNTTADVTFSGALSFITDQLTSSGTIITDGEIGVNSSASVGGNITADGQIYFGGAVTLSNDSVMTSNFNNIMFANSVDGAYNLTVNTSLTTTFAGPVGFGTALSSLRTNPIGTTQINGGSVTTTGAQNYDDNVIFGADAYFQTTNSSVFFGALVDGDVDGRVFSINAGTGMVFFSRPVGTNHPLGAITITADEIDFSSGDNSVYGNSTLLLQPSADAVPIFIGGNLAGPGFDLLDNDINALADGFSSITIGRGAGTADITSRGAVFSDPVTIQSVGDANFISGTLSGTGNASVTIHVNQINFNSNGNAITTSGQDIDILGFVSLNQTVSLSTGAGAGDISITSPGSFADGINQHGNDLILTAGTGSVSVLKRIIGSGIFRITSAAQSDLYRISCNSIDITSNIINLNGTGYSANSDIIFSGAVNLNAVNPTTVQVGGGPGNDVTFTSTIDGGVDLTVNAGGTTTFGGVVGGVVGGINNLSSLTTDAAGTTQINTTAITTTGNQTYNDPVSLVGLGANTILTANNVNFNQPLAGGANSLTVTGNAVFGDAGTDTVTGLTTLSVSGTTTVNTTNITTTGTQSYTGAVTLGNDVVFQGTTGTFTGGGDSAGNDLTLGFTGTTTLSGAPFTNINNLTCDNGGTTELSGTITTAGSQTYDDAVSLIGNTTLNTTNSDVSFAGTVDGDVDWRQLTIDAGTGTASFASTVGAANVLGAISITADEIDFNGGVNSVHGRAYIHLMPSTAATSIGIGGGAGILDISTADIDALAEGFSYIRIGSSTNGSGTITSHGGSFSDPLTIRSTNAAGTVNLDAGTITLTDNARITIYCPNINLNSTAADTIVTNGRNIRLTSGGPGLSTVSLGADTRLSTGTGAGNIMINAPINGNHNLALEAGTGDVNITGDTGSGTALNNFTIASAAQTDLANISAANIAVTSGNIDLNGTVYTASADITFIGPVDLDAGALTAVTAGGGAGDNVAFTSTVDGGVDLTVNAAGTTTFGGEVGGTTELSSLITDVAGTTQINGGRVNTTGNQSYNDAVSLGADTTLDTTAGGGNLILGLTASGNYDFSIYSGSGNVSANGNITTGSLLIRNNGTLSLEDVTTSGGDVRIGTILPIYGPSVLTLNGNITAYSGASAAGAIVIYADLINLQADGAAAGSIIIDTNVIGNPDGSITLASPSLNSSSAWQDGLTVNSGNGTANLGSAVMQNLDHLNITAHAVTMGDLTLGDGAGNGGIGLDINTISSLNLNGDINMTGEANAGAVDLSGVMGRILLTFGGASDATTVTINTDAAGTDANITLGPVIENTMGSLNLALTAGTGTVTFNGVVGGGAVVNFPGDITVTADNVEVNAALYGSGDLVIQPSTAGAMLLIGSTSALFCDLNDAELQQFQNGFNSITLGSLSSGDINVNTASFRDNVTILGGADLLLDGCSAIDNANPATITVNANGDITVSGPNPVFSNGNGAINLTAGGRITEGDDSALIGQAGSTSVLTLSAGVSIGAAGSAAINTSVGSINAGTSAAGNIYLDEEDGVTLTNVATYDGSVTINAGGTINVTNVDTSHTNRDANDINIATSAGNIVIEDIDAGGLGDVVLQNTHTGPPSDGNIITAPAPPPSPVGRIVCDRLTANATGNIGNLVSFNPAGGYPLNTDVNYLSLSAASIAVEEASSVTLNWVNAGDHISSIPGDAVIVSNGDLVCAAGATAFDSVDNIFLASATGDVTALAGMNANTLVLYGVTVSDTNGGDVDLNAANYLITSTTAAAENYTITTSGGWIDVKAGGSLSIVNDGGDLVIDDNPDTSDNFGISTTAAGNVSVQSNGDITITNDGKINLANGGLTLISTSGFINESGGGDSVVDISCNALTMTAHDWIGGTGELDIETDVASMDISSTNTGNIVLTETDAVTLTDVDTVSGDITITSGGTMTAADVEAGGAGNITLAASSGDVLVDNITALGDTIGIISSAGSINEAGGGDVAVDISCDLLGFDAVNIGGTGAIDTAVGTMIFKTSGNADINEADDVSLGFTGPGDSCSSVGHINITAGGNISTVNTINTTGTVGNPDIHLTTTGGGNITLNHSVSTNASGPGRITLTNDGLLTIDADISSGGSFNQNGTGTVSLGADITTADDNIRFSRSVTLTVDSSVSSGTGGGEIWFSSSINGGFDLTLASGTARVVTAGRIGQSTPIGDLTVTGNQITICGIGSGAAGAANVSCTAADHVSLAGSGDFRTSGTQSYIGNLRGVHTGMGGDSSFDALGAVPIYFNDVYLDHNGHTLTMLCDITCGRLVFYRGTLNVNGRSLTTNDDLVIFGNNYDPNDPDRAAVNEFAYPEAGGLSYYPASGFYNAATGLFDTAPNAAFSPLDGSTLSVGGDFYVNGAGMTGTADWSLNIPDNADSDPVNNAPWGDPYAVAFNMTASHSQASTGWVSAASPVAGPPAEHNNGVTDGGNCVHWVFTRPQITAAETVYDNVIKITFSENLENSHGEIAARAGNVFLDNNSIAFTGTFRDPECTISTGTHEPINEFYIQTTNTTWNTDATGTSAGVLNLSTDRSGNPRNTGPVSITPNISMLKGVFCSAEGKTFVRNYTPFTAVTDHCRPVLSSVTAGRDPGTAQAYNYHNYFQLNYSEPVNIGTDPAFAIGAVSPAANFRAQSSFVAGQYGGSIEQNGSDVDITGFFSYPSAIIDKGSKDATPEINSLYRANPGGNANTAGDNGLRIFIAGYATGANPNQVYPGYIRDITNPAGSIITVSPNINITDAAGNILEDTADNAYSKPAVTIHPPVPPGSGWDVDPPLIAAYWPSGSPSPYHEIFTSDNDTDNLIDRLELHVHDNSAVEAPGTWDSSTGHPDGTGGIRDNTITDGNTGFSINAVGSPTIRPSSGFTMATEVNNVVFGNITNANDAYFSITFLDDVFPLDINTRVILSYDSNRGLITDLAGNLLPSETDLQCYEVSPPNIVYTLTAVDGNRVFIKFSEYVYGNAPTTPPTPRTEIAPSNFNIPGFIISSIDPVDINPADGIGTLTAFFNLSAPVSANESLTGTLGPVNASSVYDALGVAMLVSEVHRITDIGLGVMEPVWAVDDIHNSDLYASSSRILRDFDGTGALLDNNITLEASIMASNAVGQDTEMYFDVDPPASVMNNGFWLPAYQNALVPAVNSDARALLPTRIQAAIRDFLVPAGDSEIVNGSDVEFVFKLGELFCARLIDPDDPRTIAPWSFSIKDLVRQAAGVTILNNVINPLKGEKTIIAYKLSEPGMVVINVFNLAGDLVDIIHRGAQGAGDYSFSWDGQNRAGNTAARGVYFIRVVAPGIDEFRKVMIVK